MASFLNYFKIFFPVMRTLGNSPSLLSSAFFLSSESFLENPGETRAKDPLEALCPNVLPAKSGRRNTLIAKGFSRCLAEKSLTSPLALQ